MKQVLFHACGLVLVALVTACGGGGSDDGRRTAVSIDSTEVNVAGAALDTSPTRTLNLVASNVPSEGLYHGESFSTNGLQSVDLFSSQAGAAQLQLVFKPGAALGDGTYIDTIQISICTDDQCAHHAAGSPMMVTTRYTVSGGTVNAASINRTAVSLIASTVGGNSFPRESLVVSTSGDTPPVPLTINLSSGSNGIANVSTSPLSSTQTQVGIDFVSPMQKPAGTYEDTVTIRVCYDSACLREVTGSPFVVPVSYTVVVGAVPEAGVTPLAFNSRGALPHNVLDAKFSKVLNAVVMASSWPQNALYVYDASSGNERALALSRTPTAVAISPDGMHAAVGHDALVSYVDLTTMGAPIRLDVSAVVGDLVLDARGHVFVYPQTDQWVYVHTIDIATNSETLQWGPTNAGTRVALHPSGNNIYGADNGISPDDIENYDISTGQAVRVRDSPYHGDYSMCGALWISEDGATIYTACGKTFRSSTVAANDMVYSGSMELSTALYGYRIQSLSASASAHEIALIENAWYECGIAPTSTSCLSHLNLYDSNSLAQVARYSLAPISFAGTNYAQRGLFVFHRAGGGKILLSRLDGIADHAAEYYLSVLP